MRMDNTTRIEEKACQVKEANIKSLFFVFFDTLKSIKQIYFIYGAVIIFFILLQTGNAYIWGIYIDNLQKDKQSSDILLSASCILLLYFVTGVIIKYLNKYLYGMNDIERLDLVQAHKFQKIIGIKFFKSVLTMPYEYLEIPDIRNKIARSSVFVNDKWNGLSQVAIKSGFFIIGQIVAIIMNISLMYHIEPRLCLILVIIPLPVFYSSVIYNRQNFKFVYDNTELSRVKDYYETIITGATAKEIKIFGLMGFFFEKWKDAAHKYFIKEKKLIFIKSIIELLNGLITNITMIVIFIYAVYFMVTNRISLGEFSTVIITSSVLTDNIVKLLSNIALLLSKKNEAKELVEIQELGEDTSEEYVANIEKLELKNVYYRYPLTNQFALKNINISLRKGESVAIVGLNGSGKTTFSKIMLGLLTPSSGDYQINGKKVEPNNKKFIYEHIAAVFQDPVHFEIFNVKENVEFGRQKENTQNSSVRNSLLFAGLENIEADRKLCKELGGSDISGGQWQKLAIARAHYKDFEILMLDEPTSNIDPYAETQLYQQYLSLAENRTVIYITHRISAASLADRIIVFDEGSIVEDGSFKELMNKQGLFFKLYHTQYKWYDR